MSDKSNKMRANEELPEFSKNRNLSKKAIEAIEDEASVKVTSLMSALLTGSVNKLAHTNRWDTFRMIRKENVAEHAYYVTLYSRILWREYFQKYTGMELVLDFSLFHDLPESVAGDIISQFKKINPEMDEMVNDKSINLMEMTHRDEGLPSYITAIIDSYEDAKSTPLNASENGAPCAAQIVKLADNMHVVARLIEEHRMGNSMAFELLRESVSPDIKNLYTKWNSIALSGDDEQESMWQMTLAIVYMQLHFTCMQYINSYS